MMVLCGSSHFQHSLFICSICDRILCRVCAVFVGHAAKIGLILFNAETDETETHLKYAHHKRL